METHQLILVFYLDREMMTQSPEILKYYSESVDTYIKAKGMNAVAFFFPTSEQERIECINPAIVTPEKMDSINKLVSDIQTQFSITGENLNEEPII
jgi:hypothetical protein